MKKSYLILFVCFTLSCEAVFVEDISTELVSVLAPLNNTQVTSGNITFTWQHLDEASMYQVQIAQPDFQNASQILLDSISNSNTIEKSLEAGNYEWRIKAMNSEYETQYTTVSFTVN